MSLFSTPAILLRRHSYGDYDLIITFYTLTNGKLTVIAKNAKKSRKRFAGILELFSILNLVCADTRGRGLPVLQEAVLASPASGIRGNIRRTAYASYWAELINQWAEEGKTQASIYELLKYGLHVLDTGEIAEEAASIIFQMRFLTLSGLMPNLTSCIRCRKPIEKFTHDRCVFELASGGLVCQGCSSFHSSHVRLSKGTIKQLLWIRDNPFHHLARLKFNPAAIVESRELLEMFVPYHMGKEPKSLGFLKEMRSGWGISDSRTGRNNLSNGNTALQKGIL
jgi:DNA repair protein RecO (recombination protein O)